MVSAIVVVLKSRDLRHVVGFLKLRLINYGAKLVPDMIMNYRV